MNLHLSELVSDILEPLVETIVVGEEVVSTEDMVAYFDENNEKNEGWYEGIWWDGHTEDGFEACGKCRRNEQYIYDVKNPELCICTALSNLLKRQLDKISTAPTYDGVRIMKLMAG